MEFKFTIEGRLPGMNEIIAMSKINHFAYAAFKKKHTQFCEQWIMVAGKKKFDCPVDVVVEWFEPNRKRDPDNLQSGLKFVLDALVNQGVLPNDTQEFVRSITHKIFLDKENPRIIVSLTPSGYRGIPSQSPLEHPSIRSLAW